MYINLLGKVFFGVLGATLLSKVLPESLDEKIENAVIGNDRALFDKLCDENGMLMNLSQRNAGWEAGRRAAKDTGFID